MCSENERNEFMARCEALTSAARLGTVKTVEQWLYAAEVGARFCVRRAQERAIGHSP